MDPACPNRGLTLYQLLSWALLLLLLLRSHVANHSLGLICHFLLRDDGLDFAGFRLLKGDKTVQLARSAEFSWCALGIDPAIKDADEVVRRRQEQLDVMGYQDLRAGQRMDEKMCSEPKRTTVLSFINGPFRHFSVK